MPSSLKQPWNCWKSEIPPFLFFCDVLCPPLSNKKIEFRHVPDTSRNLFQMSKRVVHRILEIVRRTKSRNPQKLDRCGRLFVCLRIEFLLKTVSGYHKDTGVTLFTLATPGNPLHYNTHRSAPPVSALANSNTVVFGGMRGSDMYSNVHEPCPAERKHRVFLLNYIHREFDSLSVVFLQISHMLQIMSVSIPVKEYDDNLCDIFLQGEVVWRSWYNKSFVRRIPTILVYVAWFTGCI